MLIAALSALAGDLVTAVFAGAGAVLGVYMVVQVRRRGLAARLPTAGRLRGGAVACVVIALALLANAVLWAIGGEAEPAIVFALCAVGTLVFARLFQVNGRWLEAAGAAVEPESPELICAEPRGLWLGRRAAVALVLTPTRVVGVRAARGGASELGSIALADVTGVEVEVSRGRGSIVVSSGAVELALRRAATLQVQLLDDALRRAR